MRFVAIWHIVLWATASIAEEPFSSLPFEDACKKAKAEKKVIMIDFFTTWCQPCKMLDRTTWKNEAVRRWISKRTIALKVDAEKNRKLAAKYDIDGFPTILFLKPDGTEIDRIVGFREPGAFLEEAEQSLNGKDSLTRAKEKVEAGGKDDPMQRHQYAMALTMKGKKKEALEEYLWCFDHGLEASPAFAGVRLSFLLMYVHQLGTSYKPAMDALRDRRQRAERFLTHGKSERGGEPDYPRSRFEAAMEVAAINRELQENEGTVRVFEKLALRGESDQRTMGLLLDEVIDEMVAERKYSVIAVGLSDPLAYVESKIQSYESIRDYEKSRRPGGVPSSADHFRKLSLNHGGAVYEVLLGQKASQDARRVAQRLLKFDTSARTYEMLMRHAIRAERAEEADWLLQRARKKLAKDDLDEVEELARKMKKNTDTDSRAE